MTSEHTSKAFDEELKKLSELILEMGDKAGAQITHSLEAFRTGDREKARRIREADNAIDMLRVKIDELCVSMIAKRQPAASDLRLIVSAIKMATDIERIGDYGTNIATHTLDLDETPSEKAAESISAMGHEVAIMVADVFTAFKKADAEMAKKFAKKDDAIDNRFFVFLEEVRADCCTINSAANASRLQFIARCLERAADHAVNIAGHITFIVDGDYSSQ